MQKIFLLLVFSLLVSVLPANAQTLTLSEPEQTEFKILIGRMLETFTNNLSLIGSKDEENTLEFKKKVIINTLRLFMCNGDSIQDMYGNKQRPAHMQTSTLRNGIEIKQNQPIKEYLDRLMRIGYEKVTIKQAGTFYLSNLYKVGDHYEATATYWQYFRGEYGDGRVYIDKTRKTIKIYVQLEESDFDGKKYVAVRFGDIDVAQTESAK